MFHNLSNYDAHFMIKKQRSTGGTINAIPTTEEKSISFSKQQDNVVE